MEYKKYLEKNLFDLVQNTECSILLLDQCISKDIFSRADTLKILADRNEFNRNSKFWSLAITRNCMDELIDIFGQFKQQPIVNILIKAVRDDGSDSKSNFMKNLTKLEVEITKPKEVISHQNDEYHLDEDTIGLALILNVIEYDDVGNRRHGAIIDSEYMNALWGNLGYKITMPKQTKFTDEDIRRIINIIKEKAVKLSDKQSLVVFIGCHGEDGNLIMSNGKTIDLYNDVVLQFDIPELRGKPKLFFLQSCQYFPNSGNSMTKSIYERLEKMGDTTVCFSTLPGQGSNRDFFLGSYYIYTLTEVFMQEAYRTEFQQMLNMVQQKLATRLDSKDKQIPYHLSWNMKSLYFNVQPED